MTDFKVSINLVRGRFRRAVLNRSATKKNLKRDHNFVVLSFSITTRKRGVTLCFAVFTLAGCEF